MCLNDLETGCTPELSPSTDHERLACEFQSRVIDRIFSAGIAIQAVMRVVPGPVADRMGQAVQELDTAIREIRVVLFPPA